MNILIVDDSRDDRSLAIREIRKAYPDALCVEIDSAEGFTAALAQDDFDAVVTDYHMGWLSGLDVLRRAREAWPHTPLLMVTGTGSEEVAVEAMKRGATDYLLKSQLRFGRLPRALGAALQGARLQETLARSQRRYRDLFHSVPVGLCRCTRAGEVLEGNTALLTLLGRTDRFQIEGERLPELFEAGEDAWRAALDGGAPQVRLHRPDGTETWAVLRTRSIGLDRDGETAVECALTDVTESRRAANEREALLGELYHRVNNTLQLLIGMITTQSTRTSDPAALAMLHDLRGRIHAISLVQQRLYETGTFTEVELGEYLRDLVASLATVPGVTVLLELSNVKIPVAKAIPIGLAANELLTNSLKHAFPDGRRGELKIVLTRDADGIVLEIADSGVGIAPGSDEPGGYGMRLLRGLVRQAEATMTTISSRDAGTKTTIRLTGSAAW